MGLLARKEVDNLVYEIYITHLYKDKWIEKTKITCWKIKKIKTTYYKLESHPYGTICKVIIYNQYTSIPIVEVEDKVICHPKDQFSRKEGRRLSYHKVKQQVNLEHIEILDTLIK